MVFGTSNLEFRVALFSHVSHVTHHSGAGGGFQHRLVDSHHGCLRRVTTRPALLGNLNHCRIAMLARALRQMGQEHMSRP
jgi:hypothetical protein